MSRVREFFDAYRGDLTPADFQRLFTRDTPEAYRYFARTIDLEALADLPWYRRWPKHVWLIFVALSMKLAPARRALFAVGIVSACFGTLSLFRGFSMSRVPVFPLVLTVPVPRWVDGTGWFFLAVAAGNLLILMEVADRLSLKSDLEIARDIQLAMLPGGIRIVGDLTVCGTTQPANTVGGDLYDILPRPDGRLVIVLGDVAGKGSPAALLMALLVAMLRTLVDEDFESSRLVERLNVQVARHSPASRFITFFYGLYDPTTGRLEYVNAGHLPPMIRRASGTFERLSGGGGPALGMFAEATYEPAEAIVQPGDLIVLFSDGITEAEDAQGRPFEEAGLERVIVANEQAAPDELGPAILAAVKAYVGDRRLADDLTTLVGRRARATVP
jgi:sigma-B regulation protein RsbU (phosphoserine phosphatase)